MPEAAENQGTTRKPMDRAAAARHAALVRWKKEQPFGQPNQDRIANRVRELLAKKKKAKGGTGGKAKLSAEQRAQQKQTEIDNNRSAVYDKTGLSDAGIDAINALESGDQPTNADDLIKQGLAEKDRAGNVRMTAAGHAFVRAADKGDPQAAHEALSRGGDKLAQSADKERAKAQAAGKQLSEDVRRETAKREKEKAQIAKGKAGGGGKKESKERVNTAGTLGKERTEGESDESPSQQKQTDNRAKVASEMADSDTGLSPSGSAALTAFADGAQLPNDTAKQLADMGLLEQDSAGGHRLSYAGRATINAMNRGDTRAALDAISRAGDRAKAQADRTARESEREKAKAQATTEREKTKTQREKEKAERTAKEDASRARVEQARIEAARSRNRKAWDMALKQTAQERAMFANMGSSGGGAGGGKKPSGGQGGLWKKGPDGKRVPQAGMQTPGHKPGEAEQVPLRAIGSTTRAYGNDPNTPYTLQHRIVDMADIQASNTAGGGINPKYDASLQPRDRSRAASQAQIDEVARKMNADVMVTDFHRIDAGTPIIDANGNVLSGNGRTLAMQRAKEMYPEQHAAYKARLREEAIAQGIDPKIVDKMEHPVLVRELKGDHDAAAFAREANSSGTLRMSPLEQAKVDANVLQEKQMLKLHVAEGQGIDHALRDSANKPFVDEFLKTVPDNERATLLTRSGDLNQMGMYRMKAAIYTKAFPGEAGSRMAESMLESLDPEVKSIQNGISGALPAFSRATSLTRAGLRDKSLDISDDLAKTIDVYARIKDNPHLTAGTPANQLVAKYLGQSTMFGRELNHEQERLLVHIDSISRKPTAMRDFMAKYARLVEQSPQPGQSSLFGASDRLSRSDMWDQLLGPAAPVQAQAGMF